jgi:hypothetical protein
MAKPTTIGMHIGGATALILILLGGMWRHGGLAVILFTYVCMMIGGAAGAAVGQLLTLVGRSRNG